MSEMTVSEKVESYLTGLTKRLKDNPGFMAYVLTTYQVQEHLHDDVLAERLDISPKMLARLALCKRPIAESSEFADQVRQIAAYTGIEPAILANIIRQVDGLNSLSGRPEGLDSTRSSARQQLYPQVEVFTAARDRCEEEQNDSSGEDSPSQD
jgi:hypothetical protein